MFAIYRASVGGGEALESFRRNYFVGWFQNSVSFLAQSILFRLAGTQWQGSRIDEDNDKQLLSNINKGYVILHFADDISIHDNQYMYVYSMARLQELCCRSLCTES